jgi:hypothetical protein
MSTRQDTGDEGLFDQAKSHLGEPGDGPLDNNRPREQELPSRQTDKPDAASFSPASQVGRADTGGRAESTLDPKEDGREGWVAPDQSDTPPQWPEPTID